MNRGPSYSYWRLNAPFNLLQKISNLRKLFHSPDLILSVMIVALVAGFILVPGTFSHFDPLIETGPHLNAPSSAHIFGTDELGRDLYARIVHGAFYSIGAALTAIVIGLFVGGFLGTIAASRGGWLDAIIMRFIDMLLAIPSLLLSFSIITLLGVGTAPLAIAVGVSMIAGFARLSRSEMVRIAGSDYIEAAYGSGGTFFRILIRHILPNGLPIIIGYAILQFGYALLQIATLGFLGFGVAPPTPEWGVLIAEGRNYVATAWWLTLMPGAMVIALVLASNRLGRLISQQKR